jgi:hypothetical protein
MHHKTFCRKNYSILIFQNYTWIWLKGLAPFLKTSREIPLILWNLICTTMFLRSSVSPAWALRFQSKYPIPLTEIHFNIPPIYTYDWDLWSYSLEILCNITCIKLVRCLFRRTQLILKFKLRYMFRPCGVIIRPLQFDEAVRQTRQWINKQYIARRDLEWFTHMC